MTKFDDIKDLVHFGDILDSSFGTMAKTSFAGQTEQGMSQALKAASPSVSRTAVNLAGQAVKTGYQKFRGINDFNAFNSLESLLRR